MPGPVGFRGGSDSISSIQGGAESLLGGGEVRPFSPGYDPSVDPGAGLWVDPNAAADPANQSPFGLDDACVDENWWKTVGLDGPITMEQVQGLTAALAARVTLTAFNALVAEFEQHLLDGDGGGGGGVTLGQVNTAINAALVSVLADITTLQGLVTALGVTVDGHTTLLGTHTTEIATLFSDLSTVSGNVSGLGGAVGTLIGDVSALQTSVAGKQASSAELSILAGLTSTTTGRQLLTAANTAAVRTLLGVDLTDNSPDASKPVSTAQLAAINAAIATAAADATSKAGAAQAAAVQRSNHTGTQLLATISDAGNAASRNVGTTSTTVAAGDAPAAAQAAAVAAASTDATTKANAAQSAAIAAASGDATTKANNAQAAAIAAAGATTAAAVAPHILTPAYAATLNVAAPSGGVTFIVRCTLTGAVTLANPTGLVDGQKVLYELTQGGSGSYGVSFGSMFRFGTDITSVTLSTAVGKTDRIGGTYDAASNKVDIIALSRGFG